MGMELGRCWKGEGNLLDFTCLLSYFFTFDFAVFLLLLSSAFFTRILLHALCVWSGICAMGLPASSSLVLLLCVCLSHHHAQFLAPSLWTLVILTGLLCSMASYNGLGACIQTFSEFTLKVNALAENRDWVI